MSEGIIEFSDVLVAHEKIFVDFWATWCGPCRMTKPFVDEIERDFSDVKVLKIDVDNNGELVRELGISSVPTFRYYENGKLISEKIGGISKKDMIAMIDKK